MGARGNSLLWELDLWILALSVFHELTEAVQEGDHGCVEASIVE